MMNISLTDLEAVSGGAGSGSAGSYDQYANGLKDTLRKDYKSFVCSGAGLKGGTTFADQVYGKNATDGDKVRASEMIKSYCNAGTQLPAAAPAFPF
jgi:hypothetical protein